MGEYITEWQFDETVGMLPHGKMREKIVRCSNCKYWATKAKFTGMCIGKKFNPNGYCAWGVENERKGKRTKTNMA